MCKYRIGNFCSRSAPDVNSPLFLTCCLSTPSSSCSSTPRFPALMIFLASLSARKYAIEPPMIETTNKQTAIPKSLISFSLSFHLLILLIDHLFYVSSIPLPCHTQVTQFLFYKINLCFLFRCVTFSNFVYISVKNLA